MSCRGFSLSADHAARYKSHDSTCAEAAAREKLTANRKTRENISCDSGATDGFTATINKHKAIPGSREPLQKTHMVKMGTTYAASKWQQLRQVIMHKSGSEDTALVMIAQLLEVEGFFPDTTLLSEDRLEAAGAVIAKSGKPPYLYRRKPHHECSWYDYRRCDSTCTLLERLSNGLLGFQALDPDKFQRFECFFTGQEIDRDLLNTMRLTNICPVVSSDTSSENAEAHICFSTSKSVSYHPRRRVVIVGCGFGWEASDEGIEVVAFCEVGKPFLLCKKLFPDSKAFYSLECMVGMLRRNPKMLGEVDELRFTLPCQDVTLLKLLNKYGTTKTAHLFTKLQGELASIIDAGTVFNEMVLPTPENKHSHT